MGRMKRLEKRLDGLAGWVNDVGCDMMRLHVCVNGISAACKGLGMTLAAHLASHLNQSDKKKPDLTGKEKKTPATAEKQTRAPRQGAAAK